MQKSEIIEKYGTFENYIDALEKSVNYEKEVIKYLSRLVMLNIDPLSIDKTMEEIEAKSLELSKKYL